MLAGEPTLFIDAQRDLAAGSRGVWRDIAAAKHQSAAPVRGRRCFHPSSRQQPSMAARMTRASSRTPNGAGLGWAYCRRCVGVCGELGCTRRERRCRCTCAREQPRKRAQPCRTPHDSCSRAGRRDAVVRGAARARGAASGSDVRGRVPQGRIDQMHRAASSWDAGAPSGNQAQRRLTHRPEEHPHSEAVCAAPGVGRFTTRSYRDRPRLPHRGVPVLARSLATHRAHALCSTPPPS